VPRRKWAVIALLSAGMMIGYIDRSNLSVVLATSEVRQAFHLSDAIRGLLNSTFFWSYALLQIPAGWVVDRYGVRRPYAIGFFFWTVVSALTGLVTNVSQLIAMRLLLGAGEAISGPASLRWIRSNCPEERRGLATGIYLAGTKMGSAVGLPLAAFLITAFSWRLMFVICGLSGIIWLLGWLLLATDAAPQANAPGSKKEDVTFAQLLGSPLIWGILIGTFCYGYFLFFSVTWLPAYLVESRGLALNSMGLYALFSFGGMAVVAIFAGWLADHMIRRGSEAVQTRKAFTVLGFLLASTEVIGAVADSQALALFFAVFSLVGLGLATANYWALTQTLVPAGAMGRVGGMQNCASNLAGVAAPLITGWLKQISGGYRAPMQAIWIVLLVGVASYLLLVRPVGHQTVN
jgi:ACS family D-galactonate transporter-like MFS transporter